MNALKMNYAKAPCFSDIFPLLIPYYEREWSHLSNLCDEMLVIFLDFFSIDTKIVRSSELPGIESKKSDLLLDICRQLGASTYLSGKLGQAYLDVDNFMEKGVEVIFQDYHPPTYDQAYPGFEGNLSAVDFMMNAGNAESVFSGR